MITATIPLNSTFEHTIRFYNPLDYALDIDEIYTSDESLIIELLSKKNLKNKISKNFEHHEQWHVKPYEMKSVIQIKYAAQHLTHFYGLVCIKTNRTGLIILPVKIHVSDRAGLYSNIPSLEFTTNSFVHPSMKPITVPIHAFNYGLEPVMIFVSVVEFKQ